MTALRSPTSFWPSGDSFFEGELSGFDAIAELSATSICLLEGTLPLENAGDHGVSASLRMWARGSANGSMRIPWKMPKSWSLLLTSVSFCFRSTGPVRCQYEGHQTRHAGDVRLTALLLDMMWGVVGRCLWVSRRVSNKQTLDQWKSGWMGGGWVLGIGYLRNVMGEGKCGHDFIICVEAVARHARRVSTSCTRSAQFCSQRLPMPCCFVLDLACSDTGLASTSAFAA